MLTEVVLVIYSMATNYGRDIIRESAKHKKK